jgi:hypothetical protein
MTKIKTLSKNNIIFQINCNSNRKTIIDLLKQNDQLAKEGIKPHAFETTYTTYLSTYKPNECIFSTLVDYSIAYVISSLKTSYRPKFISIQDIKALLDANNPTKYTPIVTIDNFPVHLFKKEYDTELMRKAYLVIQYAYWLGTTEIQNHFFVKNLNHLFSTGEVIEYNGPDNDSYYNTIERINKGEINNIHQITKAWFLSCLDMMHASLGYDINPLEIDYRSYNNVIQCPRILRYYVPLEFIQCDIKSAHTSFLDGAINTNKSAKVYQNLMAHYSIDRPTAKRMFNSQLNKSKFRVVGTFKSNKSGKNITITKEIANKNIAEWSEVLSVAGYSVAEIERLHTITSNKDIPFHSWANRIEKAVVLEFAKGNELEFYLRGHDAIFYHSGYNKITFDSVRFKNKDIFFDVELKQQYKPKPFNTKDLKPINPDFNPEHLKTTDRIVSKSFIDANLKPTKYKAYKIFDDAVEVTWRKGSDIEETFFYHGYLEMLEEKKPCVKVRFKESIFKNLKALQNEFLQFIFLNRYESKNGALTAFLAEYRYYYYFNVLDAYNALFNELSFYKVSTPIIEFSEFQKGFIKGDDYIEFNSMVAISKMKGELVASERMPVLTKMLKPFVSELLDIVPIDRRTKVDQKKQDLDFCATFGKFHAHNIYSSYCKDQIYQNKRNECFKGFASLGIIVKLKSDLKEFRNKERKQIERRHKAQANKYRLKAIETIDKLKKVREFLILNAQAIAVVVNQYNELKETQATKFSPYKHTARPQAITPEFNQYTERPQYKAPAVKQDRLNEVELYNLNRSLFTSMQLDSNPQFKNIPMTIMRHYTPTPEKTIKEMYNEIQKSNLKEFQDRAIYIAKIQNWLKAS